MFFRRREQCAKQEYQWFYGTVSALRVSLISYRLLTRAVLRRCPKRSHSLFDRKESKSSPSPIGSPSHLIFVPAKQIGVEFLSVIGKVDVEDHVLVIIVN